MCSPCLCTLSASASIRPLIPTFSRFLFLLSGTAHALAVDASSAHVHRRMAFNRLIVPYTPPPRSKSTGVVWLEWQLRSKSKHSTKASLPENSLAAGGCFECNMYCVTALDWKEAADGARKRQQFTFQVCYFKIVTAHCCYYCRLGQAL